MQKHAEHAFLVKIIENKVLTCIWFFTKRPVYDKMSVARLASSYRLDVRVDE